MLDYIDWFANRTKQWNRYQEMLSGQTPMAVMLIEAPTLMGKTFLTKRMVHHCEKNDVAHVYIDFAGQEVASYLWLVRSVREQLSPYVGKHAFNLLSQCINRYTDPRQSGKISEPQQTIYYLQLNPDNEQSTYHVRLNLVTLKNNLIAFFSHEEMEAVAFQLGILPDDVAGNIRSAYARGLITRCERDRLLPNLLLILKSERPQETWWETLTEAEWAAWEKEQAGSEATSEKIQEGEEAVTVDLGLLTLAADKVVRQEAISMINQALQDCLLALSEARKIVFHLDSFERRSKDADTWLHDNLLLPIINKKLTNVLLFVAGQEVPQLGDKKPLVGLTGLTLFTEENVLEYIKECRKIEPEIDYFKLSKGNPYILANIVTNMTMPAAVDDSW